MGEGIPAGHCTNRQHGQTLALFEFWHQGRLLAHLLCLQRLIIVGDQLIQNQLFDQCIRGILQIYQISKVYLFLRSNNSNRSVWAVNVAIRREKQQRNGIAGRYDYSFARVQKGLTLRAPLRLSRVTTYGRSVTPGQRANLLRYSCQQPEFVRFSPLSSLNRISRMPPGTLAPRL
jgi:hypothetical protein